MKESDKLENFIQAFNSASGGCVRTCECGKRFYDSVNSYDWEDGEFEALEKDRKSTPLEYSVGTIIFEGGEYVIDCNCWRKRAEKLMNWIDSHGRRIAEYLTLEKKRKQEEANRSPVVK